MTLDEIRTMTPERAVSDAELRDALRACLKETRSAAEDGRFTSTPSGLKAGGEWYDELVRLLSTYAPYFGRHALQSLEAA